MEGVFNLTRTDLKCCYPTSRQLQENVTSIVEMDENEGDDDDLLYGDLEDSGRSADHMKLAAKVVALTKRNDVLTSELIEMKHQLQVITEEKNVVENNLMILYNTALREMGRKDKQIGELMSKERQGVPAISADARKSHR